MKKQAEAEFATIIQLEETSLLKPAEIQKSYLLQQELQLQNYQLALLSHELEQLSRGIALQNSQ